MIADNGTERSLWKQTLLMTGMMLGGSALFVGALMLVLATVMAPKSAPATDQNTLSSGAAVTDTAPAKAAHAPKKPLPVKPRSTLGGGRS